MEYVFLPIQRLLFLREQIWIACDTWLWLCNAPMYIIVPFWSPQYSTLGCRLNDWVRQSMFLCYACSASFKSVKTFVFTKSQSVLCFSLSGIVFQLHWLIPTDISFGFAAALNLTVERSPCVCARVARSSAAEAKARLQNFAGQFLQD